ncbi:MAG TPA: HPP family protein [Humidesulfovibrio sp.]|uniref:HPP family protein n=1 Tax=Humidesulfovibrio sp. TaxID=2910988 RepID=UPI002B56D8BF|nr:HPP family protein [Humidesulfovibrio sp.]HWR03914.1 HPP family protein [Humidesulfovibrio sp.]
MEFFAKMRGAGKDAPPRVPLREMALGFTGALLGMVGMGLAQKHLADPADLLVLSGPFAATAVLLFGTPKSPLAQPRNVLGGHVLSALVGVCANLALPGLPWLAGALAVAVAIALMHATKTLHPPGGATAFLAVAGGAKLTALGFGYVLAPSAAGALLLVGLALVINNLLPGRRYPEFWF